MQKNKARRLKFAPFIFFSFFFQLLPLIAADSLPEDEEKSSQMTSEHLPEGRKKARKNKKLKKKKPLRQWSLGFGVELPSVLTIRASATLPSDFLASMGVSPPFRTSFSRVIPEKSSSVSGFKVGPPKFNANATLISGPNFNSQIVHFPFQRDNGWYYGLGLSYLQLSMLANAATAFLICDASIPDPCSKQENAFETSTSALADARVSLKVATFDLVAGKEFNWPHLKLAFQFGWGFTFWKKLKAKTTIKINNDLYEEPDFGPDVLALIASQEEFANNTIRQYISEQNWYMKYLPVLGMHLMF